MNRNQTTIIVFILAMLISGCSQYQKVADDLAFLMPKEFQCTVIKVNSGEKFLCQMPGLDYETIRLAGVSIPKENLEAAKKYSQSVLKRGTLIKIEPDGDNRDDNGDIPAFVILPGNRMLNLVLAEKGLAELNIDEITKYKLEFKEIERTQIEIIEQN